MLSVARCLWRVVCCPLHVVVRCTLSVACCGSRCVHRGGDPVQRPRVHRLTRAHCGDGRFHRVVWDTVPCGIRCRARYLAARDVLQLYKAELRQEAKEELERLRVVIPYSGYSILSKRDRGTVRRCPVVLILIPHGAEEHARPLPPLPRDGAAQHLAIFTVAAPFPPRPPPAPLPPCPLPPLPPSPLYHDANGRDALGAFPLGASAGGWRGAGDAWARAVRLRTAQVCERFLNRARA